MKIEPGRNDSCWCGSGKKYKYCHLHRHKDKEKPLGQEIQKLRKNFTRRKTCLHPNASDVNCGKQIIHAHTIQRNRELRLISNANNHVLSFQPITKNGTFEFEVRPVGYNQASTFSGFCNRHDDQIFEYLEKNNFIGDPKQCFLAGYRAVSYGLYQQQALVDSMYILRDGIDVGLSPELQQQAQLSVVARNTSVRKGLTALERTKKLYDLVLLSEAYEKMNHCIIYFRGEMAIASTGVLTPDIDLNNDLLNNEVRDNDRIREMIIYGLNTDIEYGIEKNAEARQLFSLPENNIECLAFSILATEEGSAAVFSWPVEHTTCSQFVSSVINKPIEDIPNIVVQFAFNYIENTFFAEKWWTILTDSCKNKITQLASNGDPYGKPLDYSLRSFVQWQVTKIVCSEDFRSKVSTV